MTQWIKEKNLVFLLRTRHSSYMFRVDQYGHLEHIHYGDRVLLEDAEVLSLKRIVPYGESVEYEDDISTSWRDVVPLEWSSDGIGDFREKPMEIHREAGTTLDFKYAGHEIKQGTVLHENTLPDPYDGDETLIVHLKDEVSKIDIDLLYTVYAMSDVITRRMRVVNGSNETVFIRKAMSFSMDMIESDLVMMNFSGSWANEMQRNDKHITCGTYVLEADLGASSNRANPGFILRKASTTEQMGKAWGFNLIYSGNHYASIGCDPHGSVRIMQGVHPARMNRPLKQGECFETPTAVMTFSDRGLNDLSHHFHQFVNHHIVRTDWKMRERPILVNDWEAFMFDFDEEKLVTLATEGKRLGAELFVLDDGWFGNRDNDFAGLGDYWVNRKKLPNGIEGLSQKIHDMGMMFGLWFEPEAVNPDSNLYRAHPDWVIRDEGYHNLRGRHELLLDLTRPEVRTYIAGNVVKILDEAKVDYVKWDMNRPMSARDQSYSYDYICSLYELLHTIFDSRPHILLESCSSGGGRFDLGMMCFSPQIWASDNTDPIDRYAIQTGYSYFYPQSVVGAHVSACPHGQTQRETPLQTRFHTAAFGAFGYELDLRILSDIERKEIQKQIEFYKEHRDLLQFGIYWRKETDENHRMACVTNAHGTTAIATVFRKLISAASPAERMEVPGLCEDSLYEIVGRDFLVPIRARGPYYDMIAEEGLLVEEDDGSTGLLWRGEAMHASGAALRNGILLNNVYNGTGYADKIRVPSDFGSEMYVISEE